ncbi:DEAD/DEAH box helicase [Motilimonas eburnea]|uniref:DEAD/DEAH box helicase n=1 Tax=Motilimonas eburnea TaxID=1737488 RepID=UPI001E4FBDA1|nr:DEAD/DEAH box helicase [Motilimonas eburnea]MCE2573169.1 DEAD/DEAH box helicase [Motilimonas eburnea]
MPFSKLGLSNPILNALSELNYTAPTPIQQQAIPAILAGKDLLAGAQTGTGKTASFVLPLLQQFQGLPPIRPKRIRALILTPTRELAIQVEASIALYGKYLSVRSMAMYGGVDIAPQKQRLIEGVDILVATPGRLLDLYGQRAVHFDQVSTLVLDEADRMLDMGFIEAINKIITRLPEERQNLLFSATLSPQVRFLAKTAIQNPLEISIDSQQTSAAAINQWLTTVDKDKKSALLSHLIKGQNWQQALIFIQTKHGAAKLVSQLAKRDISAEAFHSGRSQAAREQLLADFKAGKLQFLVATGVASRGIDIQELSRVVNYDLPDQADEYIHRIGRTGRAGNTGEAISFVSKDDFRNLCAIESRLGHIIERKEFAEFLPKKTVPISILNYQPKSKPHSANKASGKPRDKSSTTSQQNAFVKPTAKDEQTRNKQVPNNKPKPKIAKEQPSKESSSSTEHPSNPWLSGKYR